MHNTFGDGMRIKGLIAIVALLALFLWGCASETTNRTVESSPQAATSPAAVDELAWAGQNYEKYCVGCHGEKGEGGTKTIEGAKLEVPALREGHAVEHSDQELVKQVLDGGDGMPPFKEKLSTREAADLVKYIRREFQGR